MRRLVRAGVLLLVGVAAWAQDNERPRFDAAIVKPADPKTGMNYTRRISTHTVVYAAIPLVNLVAIAWNVPPAMVSGPEWIRTTTFSVQAICPKETSVAEAREMLQTLLSEELGVVVHREKKDVAGFDLVRGKGATRVTATRGGGFGVFTMADFAGMVGALRSVRSDPPESVYVVDKTGLAGRYDFRQWFGKAGLSSLADNLERETGLRLERAIVKAEAVVVDSASQVSLELVN